MVLGAPFLVDMGTEIWLTVQCFSYGTGSGLAVHWQCEPVPGTGTSGKQTLVQLPASLAQSC